MLYICLVYNMKHWKVTVLKIKKDCECFETSHIWKFLALKLFYLLDRWPCSHVQSGAFQSLSISVSSNAALATERRHTSFFCIPSDFVPIGWLSMTTPSDVTGLNDPPIITTESSLHSNRQRNIIMHNYNYHQNSFWFWDLFIFIKTSMQNREYTTSLAGARVCHPWRSYHYPDKRHINRFQFNVHYRSLHQFIWRFKIYVHKKRFYTLGKSVYRAII